MRLRRSKSNKSSADDATRADGGEDGQLAHIAFHFSGHDHFVDLAEHFFHVSLGLALREFSKQRRRRLRDATTRADEADVLDGAVVEREEKFDLVAAKRIVAL